LNAKPPIELSFVSDGAESNLMFLTASMSSDDNLASWTDAAKNHKLKF